MCPDGRRIVSACLALKDAGLRATAKRWHFGI
jgi:hypothetical protein